MALEVDPDDGARVISCTWQNLQLVAERREGVDAWGWFAMAPWAGRVRDGVLRTPDGDLHLPRARQHSLHGFAVRQPWQIDFADDTRCVLSSATTEPYLGGVMQQEFELGRLAVHWTLTFIGGDQPMPAWVGLHPWFRRRLSRGDAGFIEFTAKRMLATDAQGLPTGALVHPTTGPHDDTFTDLTGAPAVHWPGALRLVVESTTPWWVIYDRDPGAVCVEPQSAPPDAANLGLAPLVGPGETISVSAIFRVIPD